MIAWNERLDKALKHSNECCEQKSCDKCHHIGHCKIGTPLEKEEIKEMV
jgi:hypothetical protein